MKQPSILAIIPARGQSKRLPNKHLLPLANQPLLSWTIDAAQACLELSKIVLSTDSEEIARIGRQNGLDVPWLRPPELAQDTTPTADVIAHALKTESDQTYDNILLLQPTSPLRTAQDITQAISLLSQKKADAIVSVCESEHSPLWANTLPDDLSLSNFIPDPLKSIRSQDLPTYYRLNGAIYLCDTQRFLQEQSLLLSTNSFAMVMPQSRSVDIDTELDYRLAQLLMADRLK